MKKCPSCGVQNNDDSLFCTVCGRKLPQGNQCSYCGASINDSDNFCQKCGKKIESTINSNDIKVLSRGNNGQLHIKWIGKWFLFDSKVSVSVNGIKQGEYSMKEGFEIVVSITSQNMTVETKHAPFHKTCKTLFLNTSESYTYELVHNPLSGGFGAILYDNEGNELEPYKVNWGWVLFSFLFPYAPIWLLSVNKRHRKPFKNVLFASYISWLACFLILILFCGLMFYNSYNFSSSKKDKAIVDSVTTYEEIVDTLETDIADCKSYSEADIEKAVRNMYEELFEGNLDYQEFEEKYTSSEFHRIYSEAEIVDNEELMLLDYDHWTSSQDSDNPSLHSVSIKKLSDNKAIADIKLKLFKDFDSLNEVKLLLIVEKDKWVVDDFITPFDGNEYSLKSNLSKSLNELKSSNINESSLYVGRWSNYIISQGQRVKVYSAIINEDNTAKWILYMPDGSINTSMTFRKCVFQNGYVYFTDNGDISIKGTPRFRLGPNGLQTADGENMVKE